MSLGLSDDRSRRRRRRQVFGSLFRWGLVLAVGIGVGVWAREVGRDIAQQRASELQVRLDAETDASEKLHFEIAGLKAALRTERDKVSGWRARYERDVPNESEKSIMATVRERIRNGVSADRLQTVVRIARDDVACESLGSIKRFFVNNEISRGANDSVSFANGAITVTGTGTAARNAKNQPEAWFDAAVPVTLDFAHQGGETSQTTGILPLHHSVAVGDVEFRFSTVAGARSFVEVSGQRCPLS
jgi:hypothetical protein